MDEIRNEWEPSEPQRPPAAPPAESPLPAQTWASRQAAARPPGPSVPAAATPEGPTRGPSRGPSPQALVAGGLVVALVVLFALVLATRDSGSDDVLDSCEWTDVQDPPRPGVGEVVAQRQIDGGTFQVCTIEVDSPTDDSAPEDGPAPEDDSAPESERSADG